MTYAKTITAARSKNVPLFPVKGKADWQPHGWDKYVDPTLQIPAKELASGNNYALATGGAPGFVCLDIDDYEQAEKHLAALFMSANVRALLKGRKLYAEKSVRGGLHVIPKVEGGAAFSNKKISNHPGTPKAVFETRGTGGYVVVAPSTGYTPIVKTKLTDAENTITANEFQAMLDAAAGLGESPRPRAWAEEVRVGSPLAAYDLSADGKNTVLRKLSGLGVRSIDPATMTLSEVGETPYLTKDGATIIGTFGLVDVNALFLFAALDGMAVFEAIFPHAFVEGGEKADRWKTLQKRGHGDGDALSMAGAPMTFRASVRSHLNAPDWAHAALLEAGWRVDKVDGATKHYTRPGKEAGTSATFGYRNIPALYVFTSSTRLESGKWYDVFTLVKEIKFHGDQHAAMEFFKSKGVAPISPESDKGGITKQNETITSFFKPAEREALLSMIRPFPLQSEESGFGIPEEIIEAAAESLHCGVDDVLKFIEENKILIMTQQHKGPVQKALVLMQGQWDVFRSALDESPMFYDKTTKRIDKDVSIETVWHRAMDLGLHHFKGITKGLFEGLIADRKVVSPKNPISHMFEKWEKTWDSSMPDYVRIFCSSIPFSEKMERDLLASGWEGSVLDWATEILKTKLTMALGSACEAYGYEDVTDETMLILSGGRQYSGKTRFLRHLGKPFARAGFATEGDPFRTSQARELNSNMARSFFWLIDDWKGIEEAHEAEWKEVMSRNSRRIQRLHSTTGTIELRRISCFFATTNYQKILTDTDNRRFPIFALRDEEFNFDYGNTQTGREDAPADMIWAQIWRYVGERRYVGFSPAMVGLIEATNQDFRMESAVENYILALFEPADDIPQNFIPTAVLKRLISERSGKSALQDRTNKDISNAIKLMGRERGTVLPGKVRGVNGYYLTPHRDSPGVREVLAEMLREFWMERA